MTNTNLLKSVLVANGVTAESLADEMGISPQSLSYKINNQREFKLSEIQFICNRFNLSLEVKESIFFTDNVE